MAWAPCALGSLHLGLPAPGALQRLQLCGQGPERQAAPSPPQLACNITFLHHLSPLPSSWGSGSAKLWQMLSLGPDCCHLRLTVTTSHQPGRCSPFKTSRRQHPRPRHSLPGAHYWKGNSLRSSPHRPQIKDAQPGGGPTARGMEVGPALTGRLLLGLLSGPEQVWRGGASRGIGHKPARAEVGGWAGGGSCLEPRE